MAVYAMTATQVTVGGADRTADVASVSISVSAEQLDTTSMSSGGWKSFIGGLKEGTISLTFHDDFADDALDEDVFAILGTVATIAVKPTAAGISASNPEFQFSALVTEWGFGGSVGELASKGLSWPITGAITRDVTA